MSGFCAEKLPCFLVSSSRRFGLHSSSFRVSNLPSPCLTSTVWKKSHFKQSRTLPFHTRAEPHHVFLYSHLRKAEKPIVLFHLSWGHKELRPARLH
ncbi:hypothetical protein AOLI_G00146350 [Acnodon oligacanthus]